MTTQTPPPPSAQKKPPQQNNFTFFVILGAVVVICVAIGIFIVSGKNDAGTARTSSVSTQQTLTSTEPQQITIFKSSITERGSPDTNSISYILENARMTETLGKQLEAQGYIVTVDDNYKNFTAVKKTANGTCEINHTVTWVNGNNNDVRNISSKTTNVCN